ncbi:MAG: hypothetical protein ACRDQB_07390 [Thermocrispum sp.]
MPVLRAEFGQLDMLKGQIIQTANGVTEDMTVWFNQAQATLADWQDQVGFSFDQLRAEHNKLVDLNTQMQSMLGGGVDRANVAAQQCVANGVARFA